VRDSRKGSDLQPLEMKRVTDPHPHWANFIDCIRARQRPNSDIEKCFRSSAACSLEYMALHAKLRLDWDECNQTTVQPEARPCLHREYRKLWELTV